MIFAAIDVGSYELSMKIFEVTARKGIRELDYLRHRIDLGTKTYATGKMDSDQVDELSRVLIDFKKTMGLYGVTHYRAYGTSALRETDNILLVLDQIANRTGIHIDVLSNSEQRFLDYKSIALKNDDFAKIIEDPTAIVDIGGGSIQISLFDNDKLVATQNMKLGVLKLRQTLGSLNVTFRRFPEMIKEIAGAQLSVFSKLYLKDKKFKNLIIIDDYVSPVMQRMDLGWLSPGYAVGNKFKEFVEKTGALPKDEIARKLNITEDNISLMYISGLLIRNIHETLGTELLWAPGVTLCDGIVYEYADKKNLIEIKHDFEADIIACAGNISKRYMGSKSRSETLQMISLLIFDRMKKSYGLGKRERLLLQIAAILHDCGKYISLVNLGDCSYNIIMSTEIIGLSHREREIVANVVRFNHEPFEYYGNNPARYSNLDHDSYLVIAKLTAILWLSSGLDRTHKQKFRNVAVSLHENELLITADTMEDITIERELFPSRADFFEEIFGVRPIIKQKRI